MSPKSAAPTVRYLDSDDAVTKFLAGIRGTPLLALDTEGASFHRFIDRIYLLQLSTRDVHAIIDPLSIASPGGLGALLEDPEVEIVFHDADYDLRLLHQDYGWQVRRIFDTRVASQLLGVKAFGLAALLEQHFGVKLDKKHQRADWSMRPLPQGMLDYAAQDTMHLLQLRDLLKDQLERKERWSWAHEEFERLEGTRWSPEEPGQAFLRVKGARDLTRRELAVMREVTQWRDAAAHALDRSTFRVVANDVLLEISHLAPTTVDELGKIKGMPRGILDRAGKEVLDAIARGMAVSDADLPRFPKSTRWDKDPEFDDKVGRLKAVRDAAAARLELDPGVLGSRERLEAVARRVPRALDELADIPGLRQWQIAEMGAGFVKALSGFKPRGDVPKGEAPKAPAGEPSPYLDT